ncbi:MAG: hypothetical protein ABJA67_10605 [Chthonomonadales bacterium]
MLIISKVDLIKAKIASGRAQDLLDVRKMQTKVRKPEEFDIP